jgi:hypothetical protein
MLDVTLVGMGDDLLNGLLDRLEPDLLDDLRFGKIDNILTVLIGNKLDVF